MQKQAVTAGIVLLVIGAVVAAAFSTTDYSTLITLLLVLLVALIAWAWGWKVGLITGLIAAVIISPVIGGKFLFDNHMEPASLIALDCGFLLIGLFVGIRGAMFTELMQTNQSLTLLSTVTTAASRSLDLSQVQTTVLTQIGKLLHPDIIHLYEYNGSDDAFRLQAARPERPEGQNPVLVPVGDGVFAEVAKRQCVAIVNAAHHNLHLRPPSVDDDITQLIAIPFVIDGQVRSVLVLGRRADVPYTPDDIRFMESIGHALATAFENARVIQQVKDLSHSDELTGVGNRRMFNLWMALEIERALLSGTPLSLAILDLDFFKRVNDEHGHQAGDEVLRQFAQRMKALFRTTDLFCRIGGEEFALATPGTPLEVAITVAERACNAVARAPFIMEDGTSIPMTVSIGVAELTPNQQTQGSLLAAADAALYQAKADGRNRVRAAVGTPPYPAETTPTG